ncbi:MAG TPA: TetR/AcrR family transcriptional regulator [Acidimicrobiales bacterium]|nr:TetR/AcrR family transcriptional regulator [Acidimicrobiales bacterium]
MTKQSRSVPVMQAVLDAVAERLMVGDELLIRIPEICEATGVNYGSVYHHFGSREGVIDAAYNMIFTRYVEEDLAIFGSSVDESIETLDEYVDIMGPLVATMHSGPERRARRAMRARIVAAASTRPHLKELIGASQERLTKDLEALTAIAQEKRWLRDDIPASALAVLFQVLVFGRALDDVSSDPITESEWELMIGNLFLSLLPK